MNDSILNNRINGDKVIIIRRRNSVAQLRSRQLALIELTISSKKGCKMWGSNCDDYICNTLMTDLISVLEFSTMKIYGDWWFATDDQWRSWWTPRLHNRQNETCCGVCQKIKKYSTTRQLGIRRPQFSLKLIRAKDEQRTTGDGRKTWCVPWSFCNENIGASRNVEGYSTAVLISSSVHECCGLYDNDSQLFVFVLVPRQLNRD